MDEFNGKLPLFKKIDHAIFDNIDKFKKTPNYTNLLDIYNGLEEDQQKALKGGIIFFIFLLPTFLLALVVWQNSSLKDERELRKQIISKANQIIGQKQSLDQVRFNILSPNPIDSDSMMTSRLSGILSSIGIELSKIQIKEFNSLSVSTDIYKSEANVGFNNLSTDELMNIITAMIQREKFKISELDVTRNSSTNLLQGQFHAIHMSQASAPEEDL